MVHEMKKIARSMDSVLGTKYCDRMDEIISGQKQEHNVETKKGVSTEEELREFCKMNKISYLHGHGGCSVGSVIDKDYKVFGVEGLRVVDASALSDLLSTSPMGTLLMLGRLDDVEGIYSLRWEDQEMIRKYIEGGVSSSNITIVAANVGGIEVSHAPGATCRRCNQKIMKGEVTAIVHTNMPYVYEGSAVGHWVRVAQPLHLQQGYNKLALLSDTVCL
ncbi:hypothetical protein IFM89_026656 [Coptis chinensis]|uniref:PARP-type domain-containing protein n=1 Tax=Coptis chinensis TaxID=261450 RepID=A0A835IYF9_9MAGN|nr:hypothetical protein IFM89_026656 [Coptis chinensis]